MDKNNDCTEDEVVKMAVILQSLSRDTRSHTYVYELMKCNLDTILYRKERIPAELQDQAQLTYKRKLQLSAGMLHGLDYLHDQSIIHWWICYCNTKNQVTHLLCAAT
ncbi:hypothetical protein Pelo_18368 [Pelomyxa schiedti]|nr:hypothetical protein Pelo_18368 [Pelomyxa schiedti]